MDFNKSFFSLTEEQIAETKASYTKGELEQLMDDAIEKASVSPGITEYYNERISKEIMTKPFEIVK